MVGADHAVAGVHRGAFDDGQNVALHAFAGDVRAVAGFAAGDFVDFVDEEDAHLLDAVHGDARDLVHVNETVFFFLNQVIESLGNRHFALFLLLAEHAGEHVLDVDVHFLDALIGDDFEGRHRALADFHFHHALIELAFAQLGAEFIASTRDLFAALRFSEPGLISAGMGEGGSSKSSRRSSADCSARSATSSSFSSRTMSIAVSTRSRTMDSTSRPT